MRWPSRRKIQRSNRSSTIDFRSGLSGVGRQANDRVRFARNQKLFTAIRSFLLAVVGLVVLGGLLGFLGLVGYSLKSGKEASLGQNIAGFLRTTPFKFLVPPENTKLQNSFVVGLEGVPEFTESTFVFSDYIARVGDYGFTITDSQIQLQDAQALYDFLSNGQSVYRLPLNTEWSSVQTFYQAELPKLGWKFELSAAVTDTERIPGEYYTKDEKGLHVYEVADDIWYETVTKTQAEQGLHDKIVAYKAKQELVEAASGRDLPPEAVWRLRYSRDWDVALAKNVIYGVNNIYFTNGVSKERLTISVLNRYRNNVADLTYKELETFGIGYISTWLTTQQTTVTLNGFAKKEVIVASGKALEFSDVKNRAYFLFLVNKKNGLVYVVQYVGKENPELFEYIKGNLKN